MNHPLTGEWRMVQLELGPPGEAQPVPYSGHVIFTAGGTMSVQARSGVEGAPDTCYTQDGYESFYGPCQVDATAGTVVVTVRSAAVRDLVGRSLERRYEITGDTLVLTPIDPGEGFEVTYERVR